MMKRIGRRFGFSLHFGRGLAHVFDAGFGAWLDLAVARPGRETQPGSSPRRISPGRLVLDQNGQQIQLPTASDRHPELAKGSTPTYLAIPLNGGEHLPASIPTLETGSQQGENPVGPLNFDALVKANLNTTLGMSRLAVVDTPSQNYLVEFLPRRAHSGFKDKVAATASNTVNELSHAAQYRLEPVYQIDPERDERAGEVPPYQDSKTSASSAEPEPRSPGPERRRAARGDSGAEYLGRLCRVDSSGRPGFASD